jgi:hypothetical protein
MDVWGTGQSPLGALAFAAGGRDVEIELVGPHLRVGGRIALGRFSRLTDLVNHTRGYVLIREARLLKRNGDPTPLVVDELHVNQDEITFIALRVIPKEDVSMPSDIDRPEIQKQPRDYVVFTPGHVIQGSVHVYHEMTLATFVDAADPRFVPMTKVTARSLADRRVVSHFELLLVNRTQMTAVADSSHATGAAEGIAVETDEAPSPRPEAPTGS